ncbi:MAG TPA: TolC family protein [Burkholderiales bacterium]|nr:TolC family protein [Burkholderiales bacterium]
MKTFPNLKAGRARTLALAISAVFVGGCATFSADGGFGTVETAAKERLNKEVKWVKSDADAESVQTTIKQLLAKPLSADDAVQIALLNNPGLQATYAELGIAEADLVQAGRMTNPHFAYLRTRDNEGSKIEWALTFPIIDLLTIPLRTKIQARHFEEAKLGVAGQVVGIGIETRRAHYQAVAAEETVRYMEQVKTAAEASAELMRRMARAGNLNKLTQMREQVFYAEVVTRLGRARQAAVAERERLTRLMGLYGEDVNFKFPERLPDLPAKLPELKDLEVTAMTRRFDVQAAKRETESLAGSLGLTRATRFINVLEAGPARTREEPGGWKRGFEVSLQVPIFDWGGARVAKAEAIYMQSVHRLAQIAINARSEVRETYSAYRTAFDTAKHYRQEIVPLRKKISDENLLRYNGMLISVFELLADAREQVASVNASINALRDYWLAEADLQAALNGAQAGRPGSGPQAGGGAIPNPALAGH